MKKTRWLVWAGAFLVFFLGFQEAYAQSDIPEGSVAEEGMTNQAETPEGEGATAEAEVPEAGEVDPEISSEVLTDERSVVETVAGAAGAPPESYNIQSGDTLWDICQKLLDNPWYWPKLWSLNQYITNPHQIFPGDRLSFYGGSEVSPPRLDIVDDTRPQPEAEVPVVEVTEEETQKAPTEPQVIQEESVAKGRKKGEVRLHVTSFIAEKDLNTVGYISHSGEPKLELSYGDRVYLEFNQARRVSEGDMFHVIQKVRKVADPDSIFGSIGWLVHKKAVLKVKALQKETVEAIITDNMGPVERGDKIVPYVSTLRTVVPHRTDKPLVGKIIEASNEQFLIAGNDMIFLNLGKTDGVEDGLELFVVRKGDSLFPGDDEHLPDVIVGRVLVVEARNRTSTAYVTTLRNSLAVGDRVRNRVE